MKSNKAKDIPSSFSNSSLRFFEQNEKKPKTNAKKEIMQKINDLSERFAGKTFNNNMTDYQARSYESENWMKNNYLREKQKAEEILVSKRENDMMKSQTTQTQTQTPIINKTDNKLEREMQNEIEQLNGELERQKRILSEKRKTHEEKVIRIRKNDKN